MTMVHAYGSIDAKYLPESTSPSKVENTKWGYWSKFAVALSVVALVAFFGAANLSSSPGSKQLDSSNQISAAGHADLSSWDTDSRRGKKHRHSTHSKSLAGIKNVHCGTSFMKLSCNVTVNASRVEHMYLEYAPLDTSNDRKFVRSKLFECLPGEEASLEIYRLRPDTDYKLNLYIDHDGQRNKYDSVLFKSAKTGYYLFDEGAINTVQGHVDYPLLNFALHTEGFRGVVATDTDGYVVWYYNSTTEFHDSHIEAVEQSPDDHVWCINDQGSTGGGVSVRIINAKGDTLAITFDSYSYQGHECRFTNSKDKHVLIGSSSDAKLPIDRPIKLWYENLTNNVSEFTNEYLQVWDPNYLNATSIHDNGIIVNITLNRWLTWEDIYGFYEATSIGNSTHEWEDLDIEYTGPNTGMHFVMRYIHVSSISLSEDGTLYVVTFRDCHCVVGIDRITHEKKFMLSSVIPGVATHNFKNDFHKFFAPHDVSYHDNNTLCLMDDGIKRPQGECEDDEGSTCFSRAICYYLNDNTSTVDIVWDFSYPNQIQTDGSPYNVSDFTDDLFNINGGSLRNIYDNKWVAAFTAVNDVKPYNRSNWVFGLDILDGHRGVNLTSIVKIPHSIVWEASSGTSGSYRATPIMSINGEHSVEI